MDINDLFDLNTHEGVVDSCNVSKSNGAHVSTDNTVASALVGDKVLIDSLNKWVSGVRVGKAVLGIITDTRARRSPWAVAVEDSKAIVRKGVSDVVAEFSKFLVDRATVLGG